VELPPLLVHEWRDESPWLDALPGLVAECAEQWDLDLEPPIDTPHSLVVPAGSVVLKVNAPSHFEADHEADALAAWDGRGAVRLLARDDHRRAFLCERCRPGSQLSGADADDVAVISALLPRLSQAPVDTHPFRSLASEAERWAEEIPARYSYAERPFEQKLVDVALDVFGTVDRSAQWLVNQDLHSGNVLRAEREPWLVIDPKPLAGEREIDGVGLLRNASSSASVRRWLDALADLGLDRERLHGWGVAHAIAWGWETERGWSSQSVTIARRILAA
jgi:streptomycin 6-kinase